LGGCHQRGFVCAVSRVLSRTRLGPHGIAMELPDSGMVARAESDLRRGLSTVNKPPLPLRSLVDGLGSRKQTSMAHGKPCRRSPNSGCMPQAPGGSRNGKGWQTNLHPSTAWKAREMRQQNKRAASEGQRAKVLVGTRLLPRQRRIDSPITARALHCCAPHCPSTAQFIGQFIFCQCCDAPSGLDRCSARRQRFGLFWFISQFRFAARE
jgi:hypothetical protein